MQNAIEFIAHKKNNRTIEIPEEYADEVSGEFRVILILNTRFEKKAPRKRKFEALKLKLNGYKFNRDDAYEE
jgi:hypothetical protein